MEELTENDDCSAIIQFNLMYQTFQKFEIFRLKQSCDTVSLHFQNLNIAFHIVSDGSRKHIVWDETASIMTIHLQYENIGG